MGVGFTIDTPLKVARYGISSVVSLVDDVLIEQLREFHCRASGEPYEKIGDNDEDSRARRITEYLNLLDKLVKRQVSALRESPFEPGSEITRYYELLPENELKESYKKMLQVSDPAEKARLQEYLRKAVVPGSIDVNIMTKLDRPAYSRDGQKLAHELSDAMSALRGFANSTVNASIVFSAGMNQRLYTYAAEFKDFFPDDTGIPEKKITLKVSDYRSALVQGKFLAKRGLWVSEFRVESGLNCGGHAFATKGYLLGPILQEFKDNRGELFEVLRAAYEKTCKDRNLPVIQNLESVSVTMQGGITTADENKFIMNNYEIQGTGWATPFLLAPDVTNVDDKLLSQLSQAGDKDVFLSGSSPMGVPFWNLRHSASEDARENRIKEGKPGSPCVKRFIAINTEFSEIPICIASKVYQEKKLAQLENASLPAKLYAALRERVLEKSCLCHDLGGSVKIKTGIEPDATPAVCCGPNIKFFSKITSLEEMVGHIYGRLSLVADKHLPHLFVRELKVYVDYLKKELVNLTLGLSDRTEAYMLEFAENLLKGVQYYRDLSCDFVADQRERFLQDMDVLAEEIKKIIPTMQGATVSSVDS